MNKTNLTIILLTLIFQQGLTTPIGQSAIGWRAGVSKTILTPEQSMWLAGYAARTKPSEGKIHDLWAKALALEDASGKRAVLITLDLLGLPKPISDQIRDQLKNDLSLEKSQIILNSSHTHSGPVLDEALADIYPIGEYEIEKIKRFSSEFAGKIILLVKDAFDDLQPVTISAGNGVSRIQVNRRNNVEANLAELNELSGPNDFAVPVLKVAKSDGSILAISFGYACHPTVLDTTLWSGDYPGFAQIELEKSHPGAIALFFQGAGADQNPMPRRTIPLARQYGRTLAAAVERVLEEEMNQLAPTLSTIYQEVDLGINDPPGKDELMEYMEQVAPGYQKRWAKRMLQKIENGDRFAQSYPFPLQVWKLGDQPIFALGGELVVGYAIQLKKIFGHHIFVLGYCNDVMSYIPTTVILNEGGYEGCVAQQVYGLWGTWTSDTESVILQNIVSMAQKIGVPFTVKPLIQLKK